MHIGIYELLLHFPDLKSKSLRNKRTPKQQKLSYEYSFLKKNKQRKKLPENIAYYFWKIVFTNGFHKAVNTINVLLKLSPNLVATSIV